MHATYTTHLIILVFSHSLVLNSANIQCLEINIYDQNYKVSQISAVCVIVTKKSFTLMTYALKNLWWWWW